MIPVLDSAVQMSAASQTWRREGLSVGLVPTMGALHEGHLSLVRAAARKTDRVVTSIFINPLQFAPDEDLGRYPRNLDRDRELLSGCGCDLVFTTTPEEMYPQGSCTFVVNDRMAGLLEGKLRQDHFRGVLTVVAKLFHIVQPQVACFGQKDAQQAVLIRRMVSDLNFPLEICVEPIVRAADGLALSSRNAYLSAEGRRRAVSLSRALQNAELLFLKGERRGEQLVRAARATLEAEPGVRPDYVVLVDPERLTDLSRCDPDGLLLVAARVESTRLIDNLLLHLDREPLS